MVENTKRQRLYQDYTATMQKHLVNILGFRFCENWHEIPSYIELAYGKAQQTTPESEKQKNEEAKNHVYEIFGIVPEGGET